MSGPGKRNSGPRGSYFYLSYARSAPLAGTLQSDPDRSVRKFYRDLSEAVQHGSGTDRLTAGFFDQEIPLSADWKSSLNAALGTAEVFVPLLSPGYYARSLPGREWAAFVDRLHRAGVARPQSRFAPVLWIPLPSGQDRPGLADALALGSAEEAYAENGLRTLLRLNPYRDSYRRVISLLASKIVSIAARSPIGPSAPMSIDLAHAPPEFGAATDAAVFAVAVAAPARKELPGDRDGEGYGDRRIEWRAYPAEQELPLTEYAAQIAEQLDFAVVVADIDQTGGLPDNMPGVILIDPWFADDAERLASLEAFVAGLPSWVLPVVVLGAFADGRSAALADQVRVILGTAAASKTEPGRLARRGVSTLKEFISLMPILVAEAERQYLRHGPVVRSTARPGSRPRLAGGGWPASRIS
jgi:FxsC-like protein